MKILLVITELHEGGAENALGEVAIRLQQRGDDVHVACCFGSDGDVATRLASHGIPVQDIALRNWWRLHRLGSLRRMIAKLQPDIIHSWLFHANFFVRLAAPRSIPLVSSLRVVEPRWSHVLLDRWTGSRAAHFLCVSSEVMQFACGRLGVPQRKCTIIENGVDFNFFNQADHRRDFHHLKGLTIGRITRQKGIDILLRTLALLPAEIPWRWQFAGAAPDQQYQDALFQLARDLQIDDRVEWLGFIKRRDMVACYRDANIFVLPSRWEGQANVILEAMCAGLPVFTAKTDGIGDLIRQHPQCLAIVDPNLPDNWVNALTAFWRDPHSAPSLAAGIDVALSRTWEQVAQRHFQVYDQILNGRTD